jgi:hypothetical protein
MKLRIIQQGNLFVPQFYKKTYYNSCWIGFGTPNIKFIEKDDAMDFIDLVANSVTTGRNPKPQVVWKNFEEPIKEAPKK